MERVSAQEGSQNQQRYLETRIDDLKWTVGVFSSVMALVVAGLAVMIGLNFSSEKASLQSFKEELRTDMRESLGRASSPTLVLRTLDGLELNNQHIDAWLGPGKNGQPQIHFQWVVANVGKGRSGSIFFKLYSTVLRFRDPDVEGTGYKFSTFIEPKNFSPEEVFGGSSMMYTTNANVEDSFKSLDVRPELMLRLYYGDGQVAEARLRLKQKP